MVFGFFQVQTVFQGKKLQVARTNVNEFYFNNRFQFLSANERGEVIYIGRDNFVRFFFRKKLRENWTSGGLAFDFFSHSNYFAKIKANHTVQI